jgi:2-haloacid dehalogenase
MGPSAVVFDIGGVLIDWNPAYLYRKLLPDEASVDHFLSNVCSPEWNQQFDGGARFSDGVAALSAVHKGKESLIADFHARWHEMLGGEVPGTADVLRELKVDGVPVHAISNWSAETFPIALERFPFLGLFDVLIVSGRERLVKPDSQIFRLFLDRAGLDAADCVFVDDNAANIAAASAIGFHTVHFSDSADLRCRLVEYGLLGATAEARP